MNIQQLNTIDRNPRVELLTWDRDTANPVEQIIAYNIAFGPVEGIDVIQGDESCVEDFHEPPRAALILVCNQ